MDIDYIRINSGRDIFVNYHASPNKNGFWEWGEVGKDGYLMFVSKDSQWNYIGIATDWKTRDIVGGDGGY